MTCESILAPFSSSTCAASSVTTDSRRRRRPSSSDCFCAGVLEALGSRLRRGMRPVTGKWQSMLLLVQLEHGSFLSQRILRRRHITQLQILRLVSLWDGGGTDRSIGGCKLRLERNRTKMENCASQLIEMNKFVYSIMRLDEVGMCECLCSAYPSC
jgi:hypothetical protein